jgi:hypothetical protein
MKPIRLGHSGQNRCDDEFKREAERKSANLAVEFFDFLLHNKKWWLFPIIIVFLLLGLIVFLSGTGAAPFIYTLF